MGPRTTVGLHDHVAAGDIRRQLHGLVDGVALAVVERAGLGVVAQLPYLLGLAEVRVVGHIDGVDPIAGKGVALVLHRVAKAHVAAGIDSGRRGHLGHFQIGWRDAQHADGVALVVVVVDLGGIVWIDVAGQLVLQNGAVAVGPDGDVVLATQHVVGHGDLQIAQVAVAHREIAAVHGRAQQYVALGGAGAARIFRQPYRVGPAVDVGAEPARGGATLIGHLVADVDAGSVHSLIRRHHAAGDQIGERHRVHVEMRDLGVVVLVGIGVEAVVGVGHHDQVAVAAEGDRHVDAGAGVAVALGAAQRAAVAEGADQLRGGIQLAAQRQIHLVLPLAGGGHAAGVLHAVLNAHRGAGGDVIGQGDVADDQVRTRLQRDGAGGAGDEGIVVARGAVFVDLAAVAAEAGIGDHFQVIETLQVRGDAHLLGVRIGNAGGERLVVTEAAQVDRRGSAVGGYQFQRIDPRADGIGLALVDHGPGHIHQRTFGGGGRQAGRLHQQIWRGR